MYTELNLKKDDILYEYYKDRVWFYKVVNIDNDVIEVAMIWGSPVSKEQITEYTTIVYMEPLPDDVLESAGTMFTDITKDSDGKFRINGIKGFELSICEPGETIPQYEEHYN